MKRRMMLSCAMLALCWIGLSGRGIAATKPSVVKPVAGAIAVKVHIGKKTTTYYSTSTVKPLEYRIRGPLPIRLLTRCTYATPAEAKATTYHVAVTVDGVPLTSKTLRSVVSSGAKAEAGAPLGAMKKILVRVPAGEHLVRVATSDPFAVLIRALAGSGKKSSGKLVPFQPESYVKAVRLLERDLETTVYRFSPTQPIAFSLRGPVPLRLTTRLDFGTTNGVTQNYLIKVEMDGKPFKAFALKSSASHTATYPDLGEVTPGRGRNVDMMVPRGNHKITIALDGTTAEGASARIEIPQRESKTGAQ